ncbi:MAG: recombination protein RecR [Candidatus Dormibacteraeota bacterium]|nr:recombination protein RecR [Candidatus Dormibacteraeota bacterium]
MPLVPEAVERLVTEFARLPGIGPKTAQRLAFHCLRVPAESTQRLSSALHELHERVRPCSRCYFIAEGELCAICSDPRRDPGVLCVVEEALDVLAVERSGEFHGLYHVLGGALSPMDGIGPDELRIVELERRIRDGEVREVVIATDPDVEGEATAFYLGEQLGALGITVSRLAHGLPAGADLEYADELTVARAFAGRRAL